MVDYGDSLGPKGDARFATTHWSMVLEARDGQNADADAALEALCSAYWYPLYAYGRRSGIAPDEAKDLTQQFFQQLLEKQFLDSVHPSKGKFRSFLLATFKNLVKTEWRRANAQKRGGGQVILSIDEQDPEGRYKCEPQDDTTPDQLYERQWAQTLVERSIGRLKDEWESQGKPFEKLKVYLLGQKGDSPFAEMASELGTTENALKASVHRMRRRYGEIFRSEVALTVNDPNEVDEELQHLLGALSG